jgi:hypothetical protein
MYHPVLFQEHTKKETELLKDNRSTKYITEEIMELLNNDIISSLNTSLIKKEINIPTNKGIKTKRAMRGILEETLLSDLFFSNLNIFNIQKLIKYNVYQISGLYIDKQPEIELLDIMTSIYLQYNEHPPVNKLDDSLKQMYRNEIDKLNKIVVDTSVPIILTYMKQHLAYLRDIQTPMYSERLNKATREERILKTVTQVLGAEY